MTMTKPDTVMLISGACGNVGRAILRTVVSTGARIAALDHNADDLARVLAANGAGGQHLALAGYDLREPARCEAAVSETIAHFGRIDGVVHTVGGFAAAPAVAGDAEFWRGLFELNVLTTLNLFRAALPTMLATGRGSLVAIGAGAALRAPAGLAAYAAAKSGVHRLVESFADELKGQGVRVNAVLPSIIDTPQNRAAMPDADPRAWVTVDEIAATISYLLSDASSGITGALLPVSGRV